MSGVEAFNEIAHDSAVELLEPLFFSEELASKVVEARPFTNVQSAVDVMNLQLGTLPGSAVKKSINAHPRIGAQVEQGSLSEEEQSAAHGLGQDSEPMDRIRELNDSYEQRFGYTFLIRATGLSAAEILKELERRLGNDPSTEWKEAFRNLSAINELRMRKTLEHLEIKGASLSTHILDTSSGLPAPSVRLQLHLSDESGLNETVEEGQTDGDGRFAFKKRLQPGTYTLRFDTDGYFSVQGTRGLYPWVDVSFRVSDAVLEDGELRIKPSYLHIPLLLAPFGYSTYRGS